MNAAPFDLDRFVAAQDGTYRRALQEIRAGRKQSHWMWFVFPQIQGLGSSPTARRFAIRSKEEASAYLRHVVLGARLRDAVQAMLDVSDRSALDILGHPDDLKFRSSMTLFTAVSEPTSIFRRAIDLYYGGEADQRTLAIIAPVQT